MKIEKEILNFHPTFRVPAGLNDSQKMYLQIMQGNMSIENCVLHFLKQGWLVNFIEFADLVEKLVETKSLRNLSFYSYFEKMKPAPEKSLWDKILDMDFSEPVQEQVKNFKELPFFRSLEPQLADLLLSKGRVHKVPARSLICKQGDRTRDLFVILNGSAGIYKNHPHGGKYLVASLSDQAVFGEGAFLLGEPRSADVVTLQESEVLRIPCLPEIFDKYLNKEKAQGLQYRFWVQHALLNSSFFKEIPSDCLDALSFSGKLVQAPENYLLFREGERGHTAYIVVQGSLVVQQRGKTINVLNQGSFLGEVALLASQGTRTATVATQKESILVEIQQSEFYKLLGQNLFLAKFLQELAVERLQKDQLRHA